MSGEKDWADRIALDLCMAYEPRKPGMAKAISGFLRAERDRWTAALAEKDADIAELKAKLAALRAVLFRNGETEYTKTLDTAGMAMNCIEVLREEIEAYASKLASFAPFADEKGEPRKVLGTLPVTRDGCIAGDCAEVFITEGEDEPIAKVRLDKCGYTCTAEGFWPVGECYSTPEAAALAAKESQR